MHSSSILIRTAARALSVVVIALALAGHFTAVHAADDWYIVEIIVFQQAQGGSGAGDAGDAPATDGAVNLSGGASTDQEFQTLGTDELRLQDVWQRLEEASEYRPVFHRAWLQPGHEKAEARPARISSDRGGVDGTVRLYRARYLHLEADLLLTADGGRFRLKESRRMRSRELHYLDHPRFGLLVMVTPS